MRIISYLLLIVSILSCKPQQVIVQEEMDLRNLDTLVVSAKPIIKASEVNLSDSLPVYHGTYERAHDLLHTRLEIAFDWENQYVLGKADLELSPIYYVSDQLELDAVGYDIHSIKAKNGSDLSFKYDSTKIFITLDRAYKRGEKYNVIIDYTAKPSNTKEGGSAAITSDKGLFFINPTNDNIYKPQQIWTQGETENNSKWFPTIDKPVERCSQEILITVQDRFTTLSNGKLIDSKKNANGTRTDHWKQEKSHTPYLFMMAIGEYAVVEDNWEDLDVNYYVEPEYEDDAKMIFNHTTEMLTFFSDILDYKYPWDKYSQVVVRDFVSGAMENTSASVYGDFVQKTTEELIDNHNDNIVAHELFHHWFGDLVTCENWANLTLNEGFANYSEYLWQEHKYGKTSAEQHRQDEMKTYIESARNNTHPLIHYSYENKEDMFDAHSYNKGGLVLHMLRNIVGDDAFFDSLSKYLKDNEYTAVEADELRLAFEDVTGKDLMWFFDQWYFSEGHPVLDVDYNFDFKSNELKIEVEQTQEEVDHKYIFQLPIEAAVYYSDGSVEMYPLKIDKRKQSFTIPLKEEPTVTILDGNRYLLADIKEIYSTAQLKALFNMSPHYYDKKLALTKLRNNDRAKDVFKLALSDPYYEFRKLGLSYRYLEFDAEKIKSMALSDPHSRVRKDALRLLSKNAPEVAFEVANTLLETEKAVPVLSQAIKIIYAQDEALGLAKGEELYQKYEKSMAITLLDMFSKGSDPKYLTYLNDALIKSDIYKFFPLSTYQYTLASKSDPKNVLVAANALKLISTKKEENSYKKYVSTSNILKLKADLVLRLSQTPEGDSAELTTTIDKLNKMVEEIIQNEEDEELIEKYRTNLGA